MFWRRPRLSATEFALLVAIPLTRNEFADDEQRPTDFVRAYSTPMGPRLTSAWTAYAPYAALCQQIVGEVEGWGVAVVRRATLQSLATAAGRSKTVTLVAHARGPEITTLDLMDVPRLRASIADVMGALGAPDTQPVDADSLASCLNDALGPEDVEDDTMPETEAMAWRVALYRKRWERRLIAEDLTEGALAGGPAIEFHDGLAPIQVVRDRLPHFRTLDLTVCDSVLLAECIRGTHADGIILSNPRPTTPDFRLAVYREAVRFAARHHTSYPDAVIRLRRYLKGHTA